MISWFYSALFWFLALAWPLSLRETLVQPYLGIALTLNAATALFVIYRCSSKELGFIRGIDIIAESSMSGCANITILYLPPLLVIVYLLALYPLRRLALPRPRTCPGMLVGPRRGVP